MAFRFGKRSRSKLATCHQDLQLIMSEAIKRSKVDFGVSEGHRSLSRQMELYLMGRSKLDGKNRKSKHNSKPSMAADIYVYHYDPDTRRDLAYDQCHLTYIAGVIDAVVEDLLHSGKISHRIRWGANWDNDGVIAVDQSFDDYPHFELIKVK